MDSETLDKLLGLCLRLLINWIKEMGMFSHKFKLFVYSLLFYLLSMSISGIYHIYKI